MDNYLDALLPHKLPMRLVDRLVEVSADEIACQVIVREDGFFDSNGLVPGYLGLEYMAQTVASYSGYHNHLNGVEPKLGFLLGTRRFVSKVSSFTCGKILLVRAKKQVQSTSGMAAFQCSVEAKAILQEATLTVYEPLNGAEFLKSQGK